MGERLTFPRCVYGRINYQECKALLLKGESEKGENESWLNEKDDGWIVESSNTRHGPRYFFNGARRWRIPAPLIPDLPAANRSFPIAALAPTAKNPTATVDRTVSRIFSELCSWWPLPAF
jgi:hypothetical protein